MSIRVGIKGYKDLAIWQPVLFRNIPYHCYRCNGKGHLARDCQEFNSDSRRNHTHEKRMESLKSAQTMENTRIFSKPVTVINQTRRKEHPTQPTLVINPRTLFKKIQKYSLSNMAQLIEINHRLLLGTTGRNRVEGHPPPDLLLSHMDQVRRKVIFSHRNITPLRLLTCWARNLATVWALLVWFQTVLED
jgi:hypothetical protein